MVTRLLLCFIYQPIKKLNNSFISTPTRRDDWDGDKDNETQKLSSESDHFVAEELSSCH